MSSNSTALVPPPPGADQEDYNRGPAILAAVTTTTILALFAVLLRLWVRIKMIRSVGADDYVIIGAILLSVSGWIIIIPQVLYGGGRHAAYLDPDDMKIGLKLNFITQPFYLIATTASKVSIALFLLRIASNKTYRKFLWGLLVFMCIYTLVAVVTVFTQCKNLAILWDFSVVTTCWAPDTIRGLSYANVSLTIVTDFILALLPIPMLWSVQINNRVKMSLIGIMSLGLFASAASVVKATTLGNYGKTGDFLWDSTDITIWITTEVNVGIIAACLPCLKPLFKKILENSSWHPSSVFRSNGYSKQQSKTSNSHSMQVFPAGKLHSSNMNSQQQSVNSSKHQHSMPDRDLEDNISEESILPRQGTHGSGESKITKTTVVTVNREVAKDLQSPLHTGKTAWPDSQDMMNRRSVEDRF